MNFTLNSPDGLLILAVSGTGMLWFIKMLRIIAVQLLLIRKFESGKLYEKTETCSIPLLLMLVVPSDFQLRFSVLL